MDFRLTGSEDWIPASAGMTVWGVLRRLFSWESLMSAVTDTRNHESGVGLVVLAWYKAGAWIPAYAGMTVWGWRQGRFANRPYERLDGGYFQSNDPTRL